MEMPFRRDHSFLAAHPPSLLPETYPSVQRRRSRQQHLRLSSVRRCDSGDLASGRVCSLTPGGGQRPRSMAAAYIASSPRTHLDSPDLPPSPTSTPKSSRWIISSPIGPPFYPVAEDYGGYKFTPQPTRFSARTPMHPELSIQHAPWLSRLRSALRLLIIVLSGAVVVFLVHTLEIFRGNTYLDLRKGELPMTWPARTNLIPTLILFAIAAANFLASVSTLALSFTRSFRRPIRSRDLYRIVAGSFGVLSWGAALAAFTLLDKASKASLGRYACSNKNVMSNGRYQYRTVCEEQVR